MSDRQPRTEQRVETMQGSIVILAAGASRRMGYPKALLPWGDYNFIQHLCRQLDPLPASSKAVITRTSLQNYLAVSWPLWINHDPDKGMLSSLQTALKHLQPDCPWLMVCLVDQPAISSQTFQAMFSQASSTGWSSPVFRGHRGHPVIIGQQCFQALKSASAEDNPRHVLSQFPRKLIEVDDPFITQDFDTPEEWEDFQAKLNLATNAAQAIGGDAIKSSPSP